MDEAGIHKEFDFLDRHTAFLLSCGLRNPCFARFFAEAQPSKAVVEVEELCWKWLTGDWRLLYPDDVVYSMRYVESIRELPEFLTHVHERVRWLAYKRLEELCSGTAYGSCMVIDVWNNLRAAHGESHGHILGACFKSSDTVLHQLGSKILRDLYEFQGAIGFDE